MDYLKLINELRSERQQIDMAIAALTSIFVAGGKRKRGRPPAWMREAQGKQDGQKAA